MSANIHEVRSEMVSVVLEVLVREGVSVEVGDTVVLLESMKMEIPVLAEVDGVIEEVHVHPGESVSSSALLATVRGLSVAA